MRATTEAIRHEYGWGRGGGGGGGGGGCEGAGRSRDRVTHRVTTARSRDQQKRLTGLARLALSCVFSVNNIVGYRSKL